MHIIKKILALIGFLICQEVIAMEDGQHDCAHDLVAHDIEIRPNPLGFYLTIQNPPFTGFYPNFESARVAALNQIYPLRITF
jgi:hypothetical protein